MASRTQSRKSVATWSLRERAVWSRPAAGADQLLEPRLDIEVDVLVLGAEGEAPSSISARIFSRPRAIASPSCGDKIRRATSIAQCASEPAMSWA